MGSVPFALLIMATFRRDDGLAPIDAVSFEDSQAPRESLAQFFGTRQIERRTILEDEESRHRSANTNSDQLIFSDSQPRGKLLDGRSSTTDGPGFSSQSSMSRGTDREKRSFDSNHNAQLAMDRSKAIQTGEARQTEESCHHGEKV